MTTQQPNEAASEYFEEALKSFETSMKAGIKLQEESTRAWTQLLEESTVPDAWSSRMKSVAEETLALTQKNMEANLELLEKQSRASMDLLKKAMELGQAKTPEGGMEKTRDLWEQAVENLRDNAKTVVAANAEAMKKWNAYVSHCVDTLQQKN